MNILIGDPDRDFLMSFKRLFELSGHSIVPVFDGTQVIARLADSQFDIVILSSNIPRIVYKDIVKVLNEDNIPVVVISERKINSGMLMDHALANSYLSLPFLPYELTELVNEINTKIKSDEKIQYSDIEMNLSDFMLCGKIRVTNEEINVFKMLIEREEPDHKRAGPYINALNNKFRKLNKNIRIKYLMNQGYRLVTDNE
ncbi:MAG: hypothetical protein IJ192_08680 [Clostridia bacterium]|nr:hypothetical protein [Clostridia bacterium]MBR2176752.1 hypothetical protein [Clostridia bacterium]